MNKVNTSTQEISDKLDTIITLLNSLVESNIKGLNKAINQPQSTPTLTSMLKSNNLPNDEKFINEISKLADKLELNEKDLNKIFKSLYEYQQGKQIKDIKKLTYKFIYTYKQNKDNEEIKY
jgi:ABC-type transporter Mla subunit MlaD